MLRRYEQRFAELKRANKKAFVPFTLLGWPNREVSLKMIRQMIDSGASALELGMAFSDPVADGPIIQRAAFETISSGFSVTDAFGLLEDVRKLDDSIPIGILVYYNQVLAKSIEAFFAQAKKAGVDGVLIADLPAESAEEVLPAARSLGVDLILLVSPVTSIGRLDLILSQASGFLYLISRLGVTGMVEPPEDKDLALKNLITEVRARNPIPICAGFGISSRNDALRMFELGVDGVISGSRVIQLAMNNDATNGAIDLSAYYRDILSSCQNALAVEQ